MKPSKPDSKRSLNNLSSPGKFRLPVSLETPFRRAPGARRYAGSGVSGAAAMVGVVRAGEEITGITNGQFGLIDLIEHLLSQTGPADVVISTWTMGIYDAERARAFCANGDIKKIRWLVDPSMFGRRPELSGQLVERFGVEAFRAVNTHAKFAVLRGDALAVVVRSSMNLNPNKRIENFDITADPGMCSWFEGFADAVFDKVPGDNKSQSRNVFAGILASYEKIERAPPAPASAGAAGELAGIAEDMDLGNFDAALDFNL